LRAIAIALLITNATAFQDTRLSRLQEFLAPYPGVEYAADFLEAADRYDIDWALLPAICVAESGCGLRAKNNNMFGWKSGRKRFYSRRQGIYYVASRLAGAKTYRDKNTRQKIKKYNPRLRSYPARVQKLMAQLNAR
jgi:hypothetical protein